MAAPIARASMVLALILGGAPLPPARILSPWRRKASLVIAADGGAVAAEAAGIRPDWVVGDLDSLPRRVRERLGARVVEDADPDRTDLEKCVDSARRQGATELVLAGVIGGRLDHTLGALAVLLAVPPGLPARIVDEDFETIVVRGDLRLRTRIGAHLSLIAPGGARGVSISGVRYPLRGSDLPFSSLGIHNEASRASVQVSVREGAALLMVAHRGRPARPGSPRSQAPRRRGRA